MKHLSVIWNINVNIDFEVRRRAGQRGSTVEGTRCEGAD